MADLNVTHLMGRLTRDPERRSTPSGTMVCEFTLAINNRYRTKSGEQKEETVFLDVVFFGKAAGPLMKYLSKGSPLYVGGELKQDRWEDRQTGKRRTKIYVKGREFQFLGGKRSGGRDQGQQRPEAPRQGGNEQDATAADGPTGQYDVDEDDIPF